MLKGRRSVIQPVKAPHAPSQKEMPSDARDWLEEIVRDLVTPKAKLSNALRKAMIIASHLNNSEFSQWLRLELDDYGDVPVPEYRIVPCRLQANLVGFHFLVRNVDVPIWALPESAQEKAGCIQLRQGVRNLEAMIDASGASKDKNLRSPWPPEILPFITPFYQGHQCIELWSSVSASQLDQILDTVRNRLLAFILELRARHPELTLSINAIRQIPKSEVQSLVMTNIYGGTSIQGGVHGSNVATNNSEISDSTASADVNAGEPPADLEELLVRLMRDLPAFGLDPATEGEAGSEIATIKAQLGSPRPKSGIVTESLKSLRTIAEGTTASVAASYVPLLAHWIANIPF